MRTSRIHNYDSFNIFFSNSEKTFNRFYSNDFHSQRIGELYSFTVAPGGRNGKIDNRMVEIFYGVKPFDEEKYFMSESNGFQRIGRRFIAECGVTLAYQRTDAGEVICTLSPARTERVTPKEEIIILDYIKNPCQVLNKEFKLQNHWKYFNSYMRCTCLDGDPSLIDSIRVAYLRFSKQRIVSGKPIGRTVVSFGNEIIKYSLTVGLSGFLLLLVSKCESINGKSQNINEKAHKDTKVVNQ